MNGVPLEFVEELIDVTIASRSVNDVSEGVEDASAVGPGWVVGGSNEPSCDEEGAKVVLEADSSLIVMLRAPRVTSDSVGEPEDCTEDGVDVVSATEGTCPMPDASKARPRLARRFTESAME